jgi:hypothetical protein
VLEYVTDLPVALAETWRVLVDPIGSGHLVTVRLCGLAYQNAKAADQ